MALIPSLGVGAAGAWLAMGSYQKAFEARLRDTARGIALVLEREVMNHVSTLATLAASPLLDEGPDGDLSAFHAYARRTAQVVGAPIGVIGPDLRIWLDTERPRSESLPTTAAVEATRAAFATGRPSVSDLVQGAVPQRHIIVIAAPVMRDGQVVAVVATRIAPEDFSRLLAAPDLSGGAIATVADSKNVIMARSREAERFIGRRAPDWYVEAASERKSGFASGTTLAGDDVKLAFHRVPGTSGWTLMVLEPIASYHASWRPPIIALALGGTAVLLLALTFAMRLGRRVLDPIAQLTQQAEAVASGQGGKALARSTPRPRRAGVTEFERLQDAIGRAGAVMEASERRHRALAETGAAALWRAKGDGYILESRGWEVLTGQHPREMQGAGWLGALHPDDVPRTVEAWQQAMAAKQPVDVEYRVRRHDGHWLWHRARGVPILDEHGEIAEWFGVVEDIHDRKLAEAALIESEARLRAVVDTAPDAIIVVDANGIVQSFNQGAEHIFGYRAAEVVGREISMLMPAAAGARHDERGSAFLLTDQRPVIGTELDGRRKDGSILPLEASFGEWRDAKGARFFTGVLRDITERRAALARQTLLAREVDHRAKNALAVVQSVLRLTPVTEPKAFAAAVEARVAALARAHSLLAEEGWTGADLRTMAERELAAYSAPHQEGGSVSLDGPPFPLVPTAVQPLGIVLHELTTNAAKHGALSLPGGKVALRWCLDHDERLLRLRWEESGGPPVAAPARRGFGSRVIEATIRGQLGGAVLCHWERPGLVCDISIPLARLATTQGAPAVA